MVPFKVTFRFAAPVLRDSEQPIHLDALIAYAAMKDHEEIGAENPWREADDLSGYLDKTPGKQWVWKASMVMFAPVSARQWVNQIRRADPERYYNDLGKYWVGRGKQNVLGINPETFKIDTRSGRQRGYQWLTAVQWMDAATAWGVGDIDAVRYALEEHITHIGKKGVNGYGRIASVEVIAAPADEADNWMLRVLPESANGKPGIQYEPVLATLRAPYWRKLNRVMALEPVV